MKLVQKMMSRNLVKKLMMGSGLVMGLMSFAFADDEGTVTNLGAFQNVINQNAGVAFNIAMIIATLSGLILIIKGLVHLKQNYTGSGQEKHMSKGIASLAFGTALILTIPLAHMFVTTFGGSESTFNTNVSDVNFGS